MKSSCIQFVCVCVRISRTSKRVARRLCLRNPLWDAGLVSQPFYLQLSDTAAKRKERAEPADLTQSRPYLCQQKTRLNFPPESPMTRADITGGYSPCLLPRPYKTHRIRYGGLVGSGGGVATGGGTHSISLWIFFFFFFLHPVNSGNFSPINKGKSVLGMKGGVL